MPQVSELSFLPVAKVAPTLTDYVVCELQPNSKGGAPQAALVPIGILPAGAASLVNNTSPISGGAVNQILYDKGGTLGELPLGVGLAISGGNLVNTGELTIGSSPISGGTTGRFIYDNAGIVGEGIFGAGLTFSAGTLTSQGTPAGANTDVQFNNSGAMGGDAGLVYTGIGTTGTNTQLTVTNPGTTSNTATTATLGVNLTSTAFCSGTIQMQGGTNPALVISSNTGASGGVIINPINGIIVFQDNSTNVGDFNLTNSLAWTIVPTVNFPLGTITGNKKALSITGTWNLAATTFDAPLFMNITNTLSALGSALVDLQQGGTPNLMLFNRTASTASPTLALANGVNPTQLFVYNTVDTLNNPTNYERGVFDFVTASNVLTIGTQAGGTGTARAVNIVAGTVNMNLSAAGVLSPGWNVAAFSGGTFSSGTFTPNALNGNYQFITNNGAFTIANPAVDSAIDLLVTNGASAGAITFTGFTVGSNTGSVLDVVNTHKFILSIRRINGVSTYNVYALQ